MANEDPAQPQPGEPGTGVATDPKPAMFPPLETKNGEPSVKNLDFILDIPMQVSVQLGSTKMLIRDLLQLGQGSVVELEKLAGEPL
jgi:flagellar motor switch protein FliN/FliY